MIRLFVSFGTQGAYESALEAIRGLGFTIVQRSDLFRTLAVEVPEVFVGRVSSLPGITQAIKDLVVRPSCCEALQVLGLSAGAEAQATPGRTYRDFTVTLPRIREYLHVPDDPSGKGVRVAVVDTGIDAAHPALFGAVERNVSVVPGTGPDDVMGHGTFVAAEIAGRETFSPAGPFRGIAPGARILGVRVFQDDGRAHLSDLVAGMEAAYRLGAKVINLSLGSPSDILFDPTAQAVEELARRGVLTVAAAGNFGPNPWTVGTPASAPHAFAVASVSVPVRGYIPEGETATFSSRGPSLRTAFKPDVAEPGGTGGRDQVPQMIYGPTSGLLDAVVDGFVDQWGPLRGTSMSAPIYAGILALAAERDPALSWTRVDRANRAAGRRTVLWKSLDQGWGIVDAAAFLRNLA